MAVLERFLGRRRHAACCAALLLASAFAPAAELPVYAVRIDANASEAEVRLCLRQAHPRVTFVPDSPRGFAFLSGARRTGTGNLESGDGPWRAAGWRAGECLEYRAAIGAIADLHSSAGTRYGDAVVTDPQHWLVRADAQTSAGAELELSLPEGWSASAPWREIGRSGASVRYRLPDTPVSWAAALVLGHFTEDRVHLPGGVLRVAMLSDDASQRDRMTRWLARVGAALLTAYGKLPVEDVQVSLVPVDRLSVVGRFAAFLQPQAVLGGESARGQGNALELDVDLRRPDAEFTEDWTAVHELSHLLHPYLGDRGAWLSEGLATYYQNVLRARGGLLTDRQAWERLAGGFARSEGGPYELALEDAASDMGGNGSFLRVYWSGAAYWLGVDLDLRRTSHGRITLDTALSRFRDCCLPAHAEWKPETFVAKLDELVGVRTFSRRYREFARLQRFPDWRAQLAPLGIRVTGENVAFDAGAPDAALRAAITAPGVAQKRSPGDRAP